ncbi:hypothetical protein DXG01_015970 [Tephrocybe rancida]|nr:hypothetical protein DXG01_015970 [Tephrocybe rancida]
MQRKKKLGWGEMHGQIEAKKLEMTALNQVEVDSGTLTKGRSHMVAHLLRQLSNAPASKPTRPSHLAGLVAGWPDESSLQDTPSKATEKQPTTAPLGGLTLD